MIQQLAVQVALKQAIDSTTYQFLIMNIVVTLLINF